MASVTTPAIETHALRKAYGHTVALEALDIRVEPGEVFGFLGPNGAGKTTSVKLLLGLTRPTAGDGTGPRPAARRPAMRGRRIGYLPELFRYQAWLTAREVLSLHARLAGIDGAHRSTEIERVLALVGLAGRADDRSGGFSKGMQQRLGLGAALLGDPALVILDEPTSALDPVGREDVRAIIRDARERGSTVLLNSHLLGEVERLCDRVAIVNGGRVIAAGALTDLLGQSSVRLRVTDLGDRTALRGVRRDRGRGGLARRARASDPDRIPDLVAAVVALGGRVHAVDPGRQSLEDLFLELVREPSRTPREPPPRRRHRRPHRARDRPTPDPLGARRPRRRERRPRRVGDGAARDPGPRGGRRGAPGPDRRLAGADPHRLHVQLRARDVRGLPGGPGDRVGRGDGHRPRDAGAADAPRGARRRALAGAFDRRLRLRGRRRASSRSPLSAWSPAMCRRSRSSRWASSPSSRSRS